MNNPVNKINNLDLMKNKIIHNNPHQINSMI